MGEPGRSGVVQRSSRTGVHSPLVALSYQACTSWQAPWKRGGVLSQTSPLPTSSSRPSCSTGRRRAVIGSTPRFLSYRAGTTLLHELDPRAKLLCTVAIVADILVASAPWGVVLAYILGAIAGLAAFDQLPSL